MSTKTRTLDKAVRYPWDSGKELFPSRTNKSLRTRGFGGSYSRYFADGFALRRCRNSIGRYSASLKLESRSQFPLLPLNSRKLSPVCSSLPQFAPVRPIYTQSQKNAANPWGQIWVTVFRANCGIPWGHVGSRLNWISFEQNCTAFAKQRTG